VEHLFTNNLPGLRRFLELQWNWALLSDCLTVLFFVTTIASLEVRHEAAPFSSSHPAGTAGTAPPTTAERAVCVESLCGRRKWHL
jgi:hypothetical protein